MPIEIRSSDRVLLAGETGFGKTSLALAIVQAFTTPVLAIDPKGSLRLRQALGAPGPLPTILEGRHVFCPMPPEPGKKGPSIREQVDRALYLIFRQGNAVLFVDELPMIADATSWPAWLPAVYQGGRERGVGSVACAQRIRRIPFFAIAQAQHLFIGRIDGRDKPVLEQATEIPWPDLSTLPDNEFCYWRRGSGKPPERMSA